jgi:formylglycine-generating enzyme required for sulfatase activity
MQFSCDRTGFPLVALPALALEVQVLPVTKVQFERFIAEPNAFGDIWYEEILTLNPRVSSRRFTIENRERLFLTGILPEEALAFAKWLGEGFDLPTVAEWRAIYKALAADLALQRHLAELLSHPVAPLARDLLRQIQEEVGGAHPTSLLDLSLLSGGVVEWVRQGNAWVGLGAPRPEFHPNLWNPQVDEVRPLRVGVRVPYFGFRLVRRG